MRASTRRSGGPGVAACLAGALLVASGVAAPLGQTWTATPLAWTVHGPASPVPGSVSCTSATSCVAVIDTNGQPVIATLAGTSWSATPAPMPPADGGTLAGVSCVSATACVAVGSIATPTQTSPFAEVRSGPTWTPRTLPLPRGLGDPVLQSVSCTSATSCVAVGNGDASTSGPALPGLDEAPFAEVLSGTSWTDVVLPAPAGAQDTEVAGVSCPDPGTCVAVGTFIDVGFTAQPLVYELVGSTWTEDDLAAPSAWGGAPLTGVSCTSATSCVAVGTGLLSSGDVHPVAATFDGTGWTLAALPVPAGAVEPSLATVSCATPTGCVALGIDYPSVADAASDADAALAVETFTSGTWTPSTHVDDEGGLEPAPSGVSCTAPTSCVAVGTLAADTDSPYEGSGGNGGSGVLGQIGLLEGTGASGSHTLVETLSGSTWTNGVLRDPPGPLSANLDAVSCASSTACVAVGSYLTPAGDTPLVERLDRGAWRREYFDPGVAGTVALESVSCATSTACELAGYVATATGATQPLFASEDHATFTAHVLPVASPEAMLGAVSCGTPRFCLAIEAWGGPQSQAQRLVALVGGAWRPEPIPADLVGRHFVLSGVACRGRTCTAIGESGDAAVGLHLARGVWTREAIPAPFPHSAVTLDSVSCASGASCVATGVVVTEGAGGDSGIASIAEDLVDGAWVPHLLTPLSGLVLVEPAAVSCAPHEACTAILLTLNVLSLLEGDVAGVLTTSLLSTTGSAWTPDRFRVPASSAVNLLEGVACTSAGFCAAVGGTEQENGSTQPLVATGRP